MAVEAISTYVYPLLEYIFLDCNKKKTKFIHHININIVAIFKEIYKYNDITKYFRTGH